MALRNALLLTTVQVAREVYTTDGLGGGSTSTTLTTLSRAAIWAIGSRDSFLSDKIAKVSSHVLAVEPGTYTWDDSDLKVVYGGDTFKVTGHTDDVMQLGVITTVGLERLS